MVKRELASVMMFEQHQHAGTVLFLQGDEGKSWYIIVRGSVNVLIHGKVRYSYTYYNFICIEQRKFLKTNKISSRSYLTLKFDAYVEVKFE